jgi:alginate O-acetyltransferase complex protein AlgI
MRWLAAALTFLFVTFAWVFFRAESFDAAGSMLAGMAGFNGLGAGVGDEPFIGIALGLIIVWTLPDTISVFSKYLPGPTLSGVRSQLQDGWRWKPGTLSAVGVATLFFIAIINSWTIAEFIYYQF